MKIGFEAIVTVYKSYQQFFSVMIKPNKKVDIKFCDHTTVIILHEQ